MSRLKLYAHTALPDRAVWWLKAVRRRSYKGDPSMASAQSKFLQLNEGRESDLITMREGIQFFTHHESFDSFQWFCWRSPGMVQEYDQFVTDCSGKSRLLDIGSCHGVYSLTFLTINAGGRVIAVEPSAAAREILEYNVAMNRMNDLVDIVSDAAGENAGTMYAVPNWHHLEAQQDTTGAIAVGTKSVDTICDEHACIPDLVKIDVEGYELYVLESASRVLSRGPVVYLEIHPQLTAKLGYDHTKCFDLLRQMSYEIQEVSGRNLTRREFWQRHHTFFTVCRPVRRKSN